MAKVWVYNWSHVRGGTGAQWGHSSVQVEGGPYISWWPSNNEDRDYLVDAKKNPNLAKFVGSLFGTSNLYKVKHRCNMSYQADVNDEHGHHADIVVQIADGVLNTRAIELWWAGYAYETASYHTIKKNCSTTVIRALRAGGSDKHVSYTKLGTKGRGPRVDFFSKQTGWEPTDIVAYLKLMNQSLGNTKVNLNANPQNTIPQRNEPVEGTGVLMCGHGVPALTCGDC